MTEVRWLLASARLTELYLRTVARTIRTRFFFEGCLIQTGSEVECNIAGKLASIFSPKSLLLPFWNAHTLLLLTAYLSSPLLRDTGKRCQAAADDSLGGRMTTLLFRQLGLPARRLSIKSPEQRLEDLRDLLAIRPNLIIAADSHGPYRAISSGMGRIVRAYEGNVRPLSAVCSRSFPLFRQVRMRVPLPKAKIIVGLGPPVGGFAVDRPLSAVCQAVTSILADLESDLRPLLDLESITHPAAKFSAL